MPPDLKSLILSFRLTRKEYRALRRLKTRTERTSDTLRRLVLTGMDVAERAAETDVKTPVNPSAPQQE